MALPSYIRNATNINRNQWSNMRPQRQQRLRDRYAPQPAAQQAVYDPATPEPAAPAPNFEDPFYGSGYTQNYGPSSDIINHPFYDPNSTYLLGGERGQRQTSWDSVGGPASLAYQNYATQNPEAYYLAQMGKLGLGGQDARSQTAQGLYRDYWGGYQAAKASGTMDIWWPEYMAGQDVQGTLRMMSNEQLGIDDTRYNARTRWGMRGGY
jgi:hypothetical protein